MTEKYCLLPISLCSSATDEADCENCELNKRFVKRTIDNWESYIVDRKTEKEYGIDINPLINLLNEQEETIQEYKHLVKIATNLIEWNTIPQIRREWQKHLSKVGDAE